MITWRADNPETPPPMMQMSMGSLLAVPSSGAHVWPLSGVVFIWGELGLPRIEITEPPRVFSEKAGGDWWQARGGRTSI